MPLSAEAAGALLREARALNDDRRYRALAELLEPHEGAGLAEDPELVFLWADVLRRLGRGTAARAALDELDGLLSRRGENRLQRRRLNLLGSLQFEVGEVDEARATWLELLGRGSREGDEEFAARACNNLGVVATLRGELSAALAFYGRALVSYQQVGYGRGLGQSHQNLAITYREMGFLPEADEHFREAERLARAGEDADELARVEQERALLIYLLGDARLARLTAERALGRYELLDDPTGRGEAHRILGLIALGEGEWARAREAVEHALAEASRAGAALLEAEALEVRAALRRSTGDESGADDDEQRCEPLFRGMGAEGWGRRTRDRARALAARGERTSPHTERTPPA